MTHSITVKPVSPLQEAIFKKLPEPGIETPYTHRLDYINKPTLFAHAHVCGVLQNWIMAQGVKRVLKVEVEIKERTPDIGQPPATAIFTVFAVRAAYYIIKYSRRGDVITFPHLVFKFFASVEIAEGQFSNGWVAYTASNLSSLNTPRFKEGHAPDFHYKEEKKTEKNEQELNYTDGGEIPW